MRWHTTPRTHVNAESLKNYVHCFCHRIQRNDMLESARNDATKAVADGKEDGLYRRRLASKWTVLARLEVMYFPKKGRAAIWHETTVAIY